MHVRKLVKAGPSSHTVSLPKEWLLQHKLGKGSTVFMHERENGLVIMSDPSARPEQREKTITIDKKDVATLGRELTSAYINNYSTIRFTGDVQTHAKELRKLLRDFAGLEIVEQSTTALVAQDLLNLKEVSIEKTLRRMDMTVRSMFQDCKNPALAESVTLRDYDMNRMYFLLYRLLKGSLRDPIVAQHVQLSTDKVLASWVLANTFENLGDSLKQFAGKKSPMFAELEKLYLDAVKASFTNDKALADAVAGRREELVASLKGESGDILRTMATYIVDIARAVIDADS